MFFHYAVCILKELEYVIKNVVDQSKKYINLLQKFYFLKFINILYYKDIIFYD